MKYNNRYYIGLMFVLLVRLRSFAECILNDSNTTTVLGVSILPSSCTGTPRYMHDNTQDGIVCVYCYVRPEQIFSFACMPAWSDIREVLYLGIHQWISMTSRHLFSHIS